jgi:glutamate-ammonia-ligase adenylyltransferase
MPMAVNRQHAVELPASLRQHLADSWEAFTEASNEAQCPLPRNPDFTASMMRVWACSDFVTQACIQDPAILQGLMGNGDLLADYATGEYQRKLGRALNGAGEGAVLGEQLRVFRRQEMLRIAWRDLAGWAPLDEVLHDLSALADASISASLDRLGRQALERLNISTKKFTPGLVVLGMGKLGARELNFSSDVDLIFAYPDGEPEWKRCRETPEEFYLKLGQQLIRSLDEQTEHGFVFRVDMRLRPYGDSGPLVANFDALADYYQLHGREWERYAMIIDFSVFDSLRSLKEQIVREVERKGMQDNIKLGPGGIREIEFIAQAFQLVRGGRQAILQQRGVLDVLDALAVLDYLPVYVSLQLAEAYCFLRRTENRLQAYADQQVHTLPEDEPGRVRLAFAMGFPDWEDFKATLDKHRQLVQEHFEQVFADPETRIDGEQGKHAAGLAEVWRDETSREDALAALLAAGFEQADDVLQWLGSFREGPVARYLGEQGRQRLDALMPLVLNAAAAEVQSLDVLKCMGDLLESIAGRTTYLSLLVENPMALSQLSRLCAASSWVASLLSRHPILLDELLDPRALYDPLDKASLQSVLEVQLAGLPPDDLEQQMDQLRQFKQSSVLHVAAKDIVTGLSVGDVGDHLTFVAETVLEKVMQLAWNHLVERYGLPGYMLHGKLREAQFGIVAYGKFGGKELGYGSDLDIVFLHDSSGNEQHTAGSQVIDNSEFFTRLSQRIIHILNTYTSAGILYEVDMRLRPNGASGLLVSSLDAFAEYQRRSAWTWENQALVRARVVTGGDEIVRQFERIRSGVLARPREAGKLCKEVVEMRRRMRDELDKSNDRQVDLKHCRGGIVDVEFMVQCGTLLWSDEHTEILRHTDNLGSLEAFSRAGLMSGEDASALADAYCAIRSRINHLALQELPGITDHEELAQHRATVAGIWDRFMHVK